jgi:hypothetical protein
MATEKKETTMRKGLSRREQETIINFNKEESVAYIFTYEKTWQKQYSEQTKKKMAARLARIRGKQRPLL